MKTLTPLLLALCVVAGAKDATADVLAGPIINPENHHLYYLLAMASWTSSEAEAIRLGGHLATVNDLQENHWIASTFYPLANLPRCEFWIGLNKASAAGSLVWSSGEPVNFQFWYPSKPQSANVGENYTVLRNPHEAIGESWNIKADNGDNPIYPALGVVEIDRIKAKGNATIVEGAVTAVTLTEHGLGYTNSPAVQIFGGGGTGASATATVSNGIITQITIDNPGHGYTQPPFVRIAPPWGVPTIGIRVLKVAIDLKVVSGSRYQLFASDDLSNWQAIGDPFTADKVLITQEFEPTNSGRFFRLEEID